ncbi:MAG TPA: IS110 family transposase [Solirubrobacteraceae bacterium]
MIVIGVDTHKRSHTIVALDAVTGAARGQLTIPASEEGTLGALRFAAELDDDRVWAVEDCRHVSGRLERGLVAHGDRVVRVAPGLTESSRRAVRTPGKSDPIDATAIARAALREGVDTLPVAFLDEQAHEIRVLTDYRDQLVNERVRLVNRLRWHLVQIAPALEAQIRPGGMIGPQVRAKVTRGIARLPRTPQARVAKLIHKRICDIYREDTGLLAELKLLIEAHCPQLLDERGCGTVTAAIIIGHTAGAKRFPTDARFARHAGTAPIPASSGNTKRHRLHRGGDRQLNRALHIIALSKARTDPATQAYLKRKHAEGKSKLEAIRCLKRHLARRIWRLLYTTESTPVAASTDIATTLPADQPTIPPRPAARRPVDDTIPAGTPIRCIT